jgi:hypothetical protein
MDIPARAHGEEGVQEVRTGDKRSRSKLGILWMIAGLVVAGAAVIYRWWRGLPR